MTSPLPAQRGVPWLAARARGLLAACSLALLVACGPGVGGTGTGSNLTSADALAAFGASAMPLCGSALALSLQCPAGTGGTAAPAPTTPPQYLADATASPRAVARLAGDGIELELACERLRFIGTWGAVAGQPARFYGLVHGLDGGEPRLAQLTAQVAGTGIGVTLADAAGAALAAPQPLRPVPAPAPTAVCPG